MGEYFRSKIYNNGKYFSLDEPAFSLLSNDENFGINEAINFANSRELKNIFIIFAGQQSLGDCQVSDEGDLLFCSRLTGGNRLGRNPNNVDHSLWFGEYKVHNSNNPKYENVAGDLFDNCGNDSIVFDVLNTKYDWQLDPFYFTKIEDYFQKTLLNNIFSKLDSKNKNRVKFTICGFSRGGILSLRMVEILKKYFGTTYTSKIASVITIDPVVNPLTEGELIECLLVKQKNKWIKKDKGSFIPDYFSPNLVPVLKSLDGVKYFNVFQRRAWTEQINALKKPIGSAVVNAESLLENNTLDGTSPDIAKELSQYDTHINAHTPDMLNKYSDIALKLCLDNKVV